MGTPSHQKKLRADSKLAALSPLEREQLADMLLGGGVSQAEALAWLQERGVNMSATSLSQYYRTRLLPTQWQRLAAAASALGEVDAGATMAAAHSAARQRAFELMTTPGADPKMVIEMYRAMVAGEKSEMDSRRLSLLEKRAAAADAARAALEQKAATGGLSPETMQLIEEQLKLL